MSYFKKHNWYLERKTSGFHSFISKQTICLLSWSKRGQWQDHRQGQWATSVSLWNILRRIDLELYRK